MKRKFRKSLLTHPVGKLDADGPVTVHRVVRNAQVVCEYDVISVVLLPADCQPLRVLRQ